VWPSIRATFLDCWTRIQISVVFVPSFTGGLTVTSCHPGRPYRPPQAVKTACQVAGIWIEHMMSFACKFDRGFQKFVAPCSRTPTSSGMVNETVEPTCRVHDIRELRRIGDLVSASVPAPAAPASWHAILGLVSTGAGLRRFADNHSRWSEPHHP
jgi:hypothetical protein